MAINNNSWSTTSNIIYGSTAMPGVWFNLQSFQMPGVVMSPPKINGRAGAMVNLSADSVDFTDLSLDVILDKEWEVYTQLYDHYIKRLNVENAEFVKYGKFDLWVEILSGDNTVRKKIWFYDCRLTSFGDTEFNTTDADDTLHTMNIVFCYDYFEFDNMYNSGEMAPDGKNVPPPALSAKKHY